MKRRFRMISLMSVVLLLASCATLDPGPVEDISVATAPPAGEQSSTAASQEVTTTDDVQRISAAEAQALVEAGQAVLYDVRTAQSYGSLHAAGAVSLPESEAPGRVGELPTDQALIFY